MAPIPKKAMLPFTLQNSRGFMCATVAGKVVSKAVRSQLVGPLCGGGREGASMGLCHEEAPSFRRMLAGFSSKKLPVLSTLLLRKLALGAILTSQKMGSGL